LPEENTLRCKAEDAYECFAVQICAFKLEVQHQAKEHTKTEVQETSRSMVADAPMSMHEDEDTDADGEVEEESVQCTKGKRTIARGHKIVSFLTFLFSCLVTNLLFLFTEDWSHECG
jgi:hypothetical protein